MRAREVQSSINGEIEPHGRIAEADSIVGFSFGVRYDEGHYMAPGERLMKCLVRGLPTSLNRSGS